jgi:hypothetical protein
VLQCRARPFDQGPAQFRKPSLQVGQSPHIPLLFRLMHTLLQAFELRFDATPLKGRKAIIDLLLHCFVAQGFQN